MKLFLATQCQLQHAIFGLFLQLYPKEESSTTYVNLKHQHLGDKQVGYGGLQSQKYKLKECDKISLVREYSSLGKRRNQWCAMVTVVCGTLEPRRTYSSISNRIIFSFLWQIHLGTSIEVRSFALQSRPKEMRIFYRNERCCISTILLRVKNIMKFNNISVLNDIWPITRYHRKQSYH